MLSMKFALEGGSIGAQRYFCGCCHGCYLATCERNYFGWCSDNVRGLDSWWCFVFGLPIALDHMFLLPLARGREFYNDHRMFWMYLFSTGTRIFLSHFFPRQEIMNIETACYNTHWMFLNVSILHRNTPTFSLMNIETATTITGCFSTGTYMSFFASQEITTLRQPPQNIGCKILIVWLHIYTLLDWISVSGRRKLYYVASLMCKLLRNNYPWPAWCHFAFCVCILWRIFLERSHFHATS